VKRRTILILAAVLWAGGCCDHYHVMRDGRTEIYLKAPQAQSVALVMSGDSFEQVHAARTRFGTWKVTLNRTTEFTYFYLVDGKVYLPDCLLKERDDFGAENCVFTP
jgi:hypothetical protein